MFDRLFNEKQWQYDKAAYDAWQESIYDGGEDALQHSKRCVAVAISEELTSTQRTYLHDYYSGMTMAEVARKHKRSKSTVSRVIRLAECKLFKVLRYSSPRFLSLKNPACDHRLKGRRNSSGRILQMRS